MQQRPNQRRFDTYGAEDGWSDTQPAVQRPQPAAAPSAVAAPPPASTPGMTPEERRYRLNQLLERRRAALDQLRGMGPSVGQTPDQAALRASLIGDRRSLEEQIRPLDTLEAAARPTIAGDDPRAIAGRKSLAQQAAAILGERGMQPPAPTPVVKGPADFADDNKMRSMGMDPASEADQAKYREMFRLSGRPVREPAAPQATVQGPGSSPSAEQIFNEFQDNAARSSESQPRERADKAARVSMAQYAANQQEMMRKEIEANAKRIREAAVAGAELPAKEGQARIDALKSETEARANESNVKMDAAKFALAIQKKYGDRRAEAEIGAMESQNKLTGLQADAAGKKIVRDAKEQEVVDAVNSQDPDYKTAQTLAAELPALLKNLGGAYSPLRSYGETIGRPEQVVGQLSSLYEKLHPAQRASIAQFLATNIEMMPDEPVQPSMWNLLDVIGRDISRIRSSLGDSTASYGRLAELQKQINRLRGVGAAPAATKK